MTTRLAAILIVVSSLAASPAFAQRRGGGGRMGMGGGRARAPISNQMSEETLVDVLATILQLNDSQQQQLHGILDAAVVKAAPIAADLADNKDAIFNAVKTAKSAADVTTLTDQAGALTAKMTAVEAETARNLLPILTPAQRTQFDTFLYNDVAECLAGAKPVATTPAAAPK